MSKIIFLNGCGSSGKSSIASSIQHLSKDLWLTFGIDTFINMIPFGRQEPYLKFIPGQNEQGTTMHVESGPLACKLFNAMPKLAQILANEGNNLIIDEVLLNEAQLKHYATSLEKHRVYYIGVYCDLKIMQEREILRRDRSIGLSNDQAGRVHQGLCGLYDLKVDTSHISPFEGAKKILEFMDHNQTPIAFKELITNKES